MGGGSAGALLGEADGEGEREALDEGERDGERECEGDRDGEGEGERHDAVPPPPHVYPQLPLPPVQQ